MGQAHATLLGDDRGRHRRGEVVDHDHYVDRMLVEEAVESSHHLRGDLIEAGGGHT